MTVSEAQIEAGRNAVEKLMRANLGKRVTVEQQLEVIYLAMKAAEPLPQGDEVERAIEQLVAEGRSGRHMYNAEQNEALDDEARAFYRKVYERFRAALVRSKLPIDRDDERLRQAARNARAWVFECWGWLMETDLDMKCPMEVDPLDIVEQIDAVLGIDPAITAIGSQSIEGERLHD